MTYSWRAMLAHVAVAAAVVGIVGCVSCGRERVAKAAEISSENTTPN